MSFLPTQSARVSPWYAATLLIVPSADFPAWEVLQLSVEVEDFGSSF